MTLQRRLWSMPMTLLLVVMIAAAVVVVEHCARNGESEREATQQCPWP